MGCFWPGRDVLTKRLFTYSEQSNLIRWPNYNVNLASGYQYLHHQYDRALVQFNKAIEIDPSYAKTYIKLADLYQASGKYDLWLQNCKKHAVLNKHPYRTHLVEQFSQAYAAGGYRAAVRRLIELQN